MKLKELHKAEFWIATILYLFSIVILISKTVEGNGEGNYFFEQEHIHYSEFSNYFIPEIFRISTIYSSFLLLNFCLIPPILQKRNQTMNYALIIGLYVIVGIITSVCKTYSEAYELIAFDTIQDAYNHIFFKGFSYAIWLIILITAYVLVKELVVFLIQNRRNPQGQNQLKTDIAIGLTFWFVGLLMWVTTNSAFEIMIVWTLVIFSSVGIVVYSIHQLLPRIYPVNQKFKTYFLQILAISLLLAAPIALIAVFFFYPHEEGALVTILFHIPTQLFISAPFAWFLYKRRLANTNELTSLRTELGKSDASLSFLQSQINPHFLFNALNTLYGTALQENAERTGEGIQKLGDMMRFMLHENVQDKISLTRDIDYLENYIALQKLRTSK